MPTCWASASSSPAPYEAARPLFERALAPLLVAAAAIATGKEVQRPAVEQALVALEQRGWTLRAPTEESTKESGGQASNDGEGRSVKKRNG